MATEFILEIAAFSLQGALTAQDAGGHRVELCENPLEGGTTPSYGILKLARKKIEIPVFPIIRARGGDFLYSHDEFDAMKQDVLLCKNLGYEGVVLGLLKKDGSIDVKRTTELVELAYPLEVTFHRAFDRCNDPCKGLEDVINAGCQRILTSGQVPDAINGAALISKLIEQADGRIIIMPGSGIRSNNIYELAKATGAAEFHTSARMTIKGEMDFKAEGMNESLSSVSVDIIEVRNTLSQLKKAFEG